jgi:hypothetical protein
VRVTATAPAARGLGAAEVDAGVGDGATVGDTTGDGLPAVGTDDTAGAGELEAGAGDPPQPDTRRPMASTAITRRRGTSANSDPRQ